MDILTIQERQYTLPATSDSGGIPMTTATKIEIFAASLQNLDPYLAEQMRRIEKTHAYVCVQNHI